MSLKHQERIARLERRISDLERENADMRTALIESVVISGWQCSLLTSPQDIKAINALRLKRQTILLMPKAIAMLKSRVAHISVMILPRLES